MPKRRKKRQPGPFSKGGGPNAPDWHKRVTARVNEIAGDLILVDLARMTGANAETVRRYRNTGRMPIQFLAAFCLAFQVDPRWVLYGSTAQKFRARRPRR